ncbi:MAG: hypothetical protein Q4P36_06700 [Bowdeniella nasicola]|nr:hypothetical protein [Bowdeniella nasicola]
MATTVLLTRPNGDVQVGLPGGPWPVRVLHGLGPRVARALEDRIYGSRHPIVLDRAEQTRLEGVLTELKRLGHLGAPRPSPLGVLAMDAHRLTARVAHLALDAGQDVRLDSHPSPVCRPKARTELRRAIARVAPPETDAPVRAVLTCSHLPDPARIAPLMREDVPFVVLSVDPYRVEVSPLVMPGATPCPTCRELHRAERDREHYFLATQLRLRPLPAIPAHTIDLAAAQAYLTLTQQPKPAPAGIALRIDLATGQARPSVWRAHPECPCRSPLAGTPRSLHPRSSERGAAGEQVPPGAAHPRT